MYEYWKQRLDAQGLRVYEAMERAAQQNSDRADFSGAIPAASISAATEAFLGDHPEFFQYGSEFQVVRRGAPPMGYPQGEETILRFKLLYSPFEIRRIRASMEKLADDFQRRFPAGGEAAERAVAEWIARNVKYNINNTRNQNAASALYFHSAQCSGISRAVKYLCDRIGIECIVVAGTGSGQNGSGPHAWNIVRINGNYYHLDATYLLGANPNASAPLRYLYFNYSDAAMQSTHVWDRASVPVCSDTSYEGAQGGEAQTPVQRTQAPVQRAIPVQAPQAPAQRTQAPVQRAPVSAEQGSAASSAETISSIYEFKRLLSRGERSYSIVYRCEFPLQRQQELLMQAAQDHCRERNISCTIRLSFRDGVWTITIDK